MHPSQSLHLSRGLSREERRNKLSKQQAHSVRQAEKEKRVLFKLEGHKTKEPNLAELPEARKLLKYSAMTPNQSADPS